MQEHGISNVREYRTLDQVVTVNSDFINNILYGDDTVLLAVSPAGM